MVLILRRVGLVPRAEKNAKEKQANNANFIEPENELDFIT